MGFTWKCDESKAKQSSASGVLVLHPGRLQDHLLIVETVGAVSYARPASLVSVATKYLALMYRIVTTGKSFTRDQLP